MTKEEMKKILKEIKRIYQEWDEAELLDYLSDLMYELEDL